MAACITKPPRNFSTHFGPLFTCTINTSLLIAICRHPSPNRECTSCLWIKYIDSKIVAGKASLQRNCGDEVQAGKIREDTSPEQSYRFDQRMPTTYGLYHMKLKLSFSSLKNSIQRGVKQASEGVSGLKNSLIFHQSRDKPAKNEVAKKKILDPQGSFLQQWNKIFVITSIIAVSLDPLFFYIPVMNSNKMCLDLDNNLKIISCVLRTLFDLFYILHIIFEFRTGFIAPPSRIFGRGELIEDSFAIAKRYFCSYFFVDLLSILPLPQVTILFIIPNSKGPVSLITKDLLRFVILTQYIPRFIRIYPLYTEVTRTSGIFTQTPWAGAAFNLFIYMLASHMIGSFWYVLSIDRKDSCWRAACKANCDVNSLYCGEKREGDYAFLTTSCPLLQPDEIKSSSDFDFGIFLDALQSHVVETKDFPQKLLFCFWWGLRNLSSVGQNLKTSTYVPEILFAIFISIIGLVLFALLIGNMQKYLQSITVRVEEMRVKRRDAELWMSHRMLPDELRERIRRYEQYKWQENRGVDEQSLIHNLPKDLKRDIKRHLCLSLLMKVPMFQTMDEQLLDAMCDRLNPVLYTENSCIVREGDPVDEMLFIIRGELLTVTTNGGRTGFFNSTYLKGGDFCGDELLTWALDPNLSSSLPLSTRTVRPVTDVEAFALKADDLKFVASQFRRLHSKRLQHTFRHCRKKQEQTLREEEKRLRDALAKVGESSSPSLGAAIYASRFASNMLHNLKRNRSNSPKLLPTMVLSMLPQKPVDPDFSAYLNRFCLAHGEQNRRQLALAL
ncbi:Cyclic nucleotide-binding domain-containing protein [Cynara cardunculus var. scolymus]|uniref:Cyclic nucleotide-binding domain-containing protein n=1 Tax=Cynara cardunculus var. scolymus TaxID=59895 RepID=A0A124SBM3_CYNCS|nr:Cyclic nucleotide-binding domain-containing protein [Cynara cardunculus var. scolymus]